MRRQHVQYIYGATSSSSTSPGPAARSITPGLRCSDAGIVQIGIHCQANLEGLLDVSPHVPSLMSSESRNTSVAVLLIQKAEEGGETRG